MLDLTVMAIGEDEAIEITLFFMATGDIVGHLARADSRFLQDAKFPPHFQFVLYPFMRALRRLCKEPNADAREYRVKWK